jgi:hypothetical protein
MPLRISSATSLDTLRRHAKRWLKAIRSDDADARARFVRWRDVPPATVTLRDVQFALAREYGYQDWTALTEAVSRGQIETPGGALALRSHAEFDQLATDFVAAFEAGDEAALARVNECYRRAFTFDDLTAEVWRRVYAYRQRAFRSGHREHLDVGEAQTIIAQDAGYGSWSVLTRAVTTGARPVPPFEIDEKENAIAPRRRLTDAEWDALVATMKERGIATLDAQGLMTDAVLARVACLEHVTALRLNGSRELSDDGLRHLAGMPQLEQLYLSEYPGGKLTDRGLAALRHLSNLRTFAVAWQRGISDAGVANLRGCDRLERVDLMGSPTGDGAIEALQNKQHLRHVSTGRLVTDMGLSLLGNFPALRNDSGMDQRGRLLIDGPFTNAGLAQLAGLEGVYELDLFWHVSGITSDGMAHLLDLPNLRALGADGALSDDVAMRHFAAIPRLERLRAQEAVATDAGFAALAASSTLEGFWGRECPNFGSRGFAALSKLPRLRALGVGCRNVDDAALSTLPDFPALEELTPIGVQDDGFRHVGRCMRLVRLTCMYCRETTDAATAHIRDVRIQYYYAGLTQITDRSLEILGGMDSLEQVDLYECAGVTDAGLPFLARLPRLREVHLDGLPGVTLPGTRVFPRGVRVKYTT